MIDCTENGKMSPWYDTDCQSFSAMVMQHPDGKRFKNSRIVRIKTYSYHLG